MKVDEGFTCFFQQEFAAVASAAYLVVRDREAAEDVTQEAFMILTRHWKRVSRYDNPRAWVRRVAMRLAIRHSKKQKRHETLLDQMEASRLPRYGIDPDVIEAVGRLPHSQRAAVALFYFDDMTLREVADVLGCSESTAGVHLHKARKKLARLLGDEVEVNVS